MRLLLDTQVFLWVVTDSPRLSTEARAQILGAERVHVSAASFWEVAFKQAIGKLDIDAAGLLAVLVPSGLVELPVTAAHAVRTRSLPLHHRDPFDRLIVAQAIEEPLRLLTADRQLQPYSELVELV